MMFLRCWASTLNKLLKDLLHGVCRHWFFALILVAAYVIMFVIMSQARVERDNGEIINYELTQKIDSLKLHNK